MKVALIIPAYNEEASIFQTVSEAKKFCDIIVVNDCSKDKTAELAASAGAIVITNEVNGGYDQSIDFGFKKAAESGYTHVITFDADGQHPHSILPVFIEKFKEGYELILGVRHRSQRISESLFSVYTRVRFKISDPLSGLKGYNLKLYKQLGHFDSYKSIGTELCLFALNNGARSIEIPYVMNDRLDGAPKFGTTMRANLKIFKAMVHPWFHPENK